MAKTTSRRKLAALVGFTALVIFASFYLLRPTGAQTAGTWEVEAINQLLGTSTNSAKTGNDASPGNSQNVSSGQLLTRNRSNQNPGAVSSVQPGVPAHPAAAPENQPPVAEDPAQPPEDPPVEPPLPECTIPLTMILDELTGLLVPIPCLEVIVIP